MNKNDSLIAALKFAPLLEKYFLTYLIAQKKSSPRTVSTYRDSFTLYLRFMASVYGIAPDRIEMNHFSLDHLSAFGTYMETIRNCSPSTINLRMSAIKSFLKYAAVEAPEYSGIIRKSLSLPARKADKQVMSFITKNDAILLSGWLTAEANSIYCLQLPTSLLPSTSKTFLFPEYLYVDMTVLSKG